MKVEYIREISESKAKKKAKTKPAAKRERSPKQKAYNEFFKAQLQAALDAHNKSSKDNAKSMADLTAEEKKAFFNGVKTGWAAKKQSLSAADDGVSDLELFRNAIAEISQSAKNTPNFQALVSALHIIQKVASSTSNKDVAKQLDNIAETLEEVLDDEDI